MFRVSVMHIAGTCPSFKILSPRLRGLYSLFNAISTDDKRFFTGVAIVSGKTRERSCWRSIEYIIPSIIDFYYIQYKAKFFKFCCRKKIYIYFSSQFSLYFLYIIILITFYFLYRAINQYFDSYFVSLLNKSTLQFSEKF